MLRRINKMFALLVAFKDSLPHAFSTWVYCMLLRCQSKYIGWLKTQTHAVNASWKRMCQLGFTDKVEGFFLLALSNGHLSSYFTNCNKGAHTFWYSTDKNYHLMMMVTKSIVVYEIWLVEWFIVFYASLCFKFVIYDKIGTLLLY